MRLSLVPPNNRETSTSLMRKDINIAILKTLKTDYFLSEEFYQVGRGNNCDIKILDPTVSREHFVLMRSRCGSHYIIVDWFPGSTRKSGGIIVDGNPVEVFELKKHHTITLSSKVILYYQNVHIKTIDPEATYT